MCNHGHDGKISDRGLDRMDQAWRARSVHEIQARSDIFPEWSNGQSF